MRMSADEGLGIFRDYMSDKATGMLSAGLLFAMSPELFDLLLKTMSEKYKELYKKEAQSAFPSIDISLPSIEEIRNRMEAGSHHS